MTPQAEQQYCRDTFGFACLHIPFPYRRAIQPGPVKTVHPGVKLMQKALMLPSDPHSP
jgi:hypothetical protein